jgi:hypothetical protein
MGNLADYEGVDLDDLDDIDKEFAESSSKEFVKLEAGENVVRFLPAPLGKGKKGKKPWMKIHEHYIDIKKGGEDKTVRFVCPRRMTKGKERCPACDMVDRLSKGNAADKEHAKDFQATLRIYANVIVRGQEEAGPKVLAFGKSIHDRLKSIANSRRGGDYMIPTEKGVDIIIEREGTGRKTKYTVSADREYSPLSDEEEEAIEWIENQWPLMEYATLDEYEVNAALMAGEDPRDTRRRSSRAMGSGENKALGSGEEEPRRRRRRRDEDEDEEPRRRRRRSSRSAQDELDDEDGQVIDAEFSSREDEDDIPY